MSTITVQQHFYASAPVGMSGSRGLQTVGVSPALLEAGLVDPLQAHCIYAPPEDVAEAEFPVNWGWFHFDDEWACLHRIGYSGTDELGRGGNYQAHNLLVRRSELEWIDYDVTSILAWVRERSPFRYASEAGIEDGFVRRHERLYERFGNTREALASIPPLTIPVTELVELSARRDREVASRWLPRLREAFGPTALSQLFRGVFREPNDLTPLVVLGLCDGANESRLELALMESLFAFAPYHLRRRLTFRTYCPQPQQLAYALKMAQGGQAYLRSRVVFCPALPVLRGQAAQATMLVCQCGSTAVTSPPPSPIVGQLIDDWLAKPGDSETIYRVRAVASQFDFPHEATGIDQASQLAQLIGAAKPLELSREDYDLLHAMAPALRCSSPALGKLCETAIKQFFVALKRDAARFAAFVDDFVIIMTRPTNLMAGANLLTTCAGGDLCAMVETLYSHGRQLACHEAIGKLLDVILSDAVSGDVRDLLLKALGAKAADLPKNISGEDVLRFWETIAKRRSPDLPNYDEMLDVFAAALSAAYATRIDSESVDGGLDPRVTSLLEAAPLRTPAQLAERLGVVVQLCRANPGEVAERACASFLKSLAAQGRLTADLTEGLCANSPSIILAMFAPWHSLAREFPDLKESLDRALAEPRLVAEYWRGPEEYWSPLWEYSLQQAWAEQGAANENFDAAILPLYTEDGAAQLGSRLLRQLTRAGASHLAPCVRSHLLFLGLQPSREGDESRRGAATRVQGDHLVQLLRGLVELGIPPKSGVAPVWDWTMDPGVLARVVEIVPDFKDQARLFFLVGTKLTVAPEAVTALRRSLTAPFEAAHSTPASDPAIGRWWQLWIRRGIESGVGAEAARDVKEAHFNDKFSSGIVDMLSETPSLLSPSRNQTPFARFILEQCGDNVWARLAIRVFKGCDLSRGNPSDDEWIRQWLAWFGKDMERGVLIAELAQRPNRNRALLRDAWSSILQSYRSVHPDFSRLSCLLKTLLSHPLHGDLRSLAEDSLRTNGRGYVKQILDEHQRYRSGVQGLKNEELSGTLRHHVALCLTVIEVQDDVVTEENLASFWTLLLEYLKSIARDNGTLLLQAAPAVARLGVRICAFDTFHADRQWQQLARRLSPDQSFVAEPANPHDTLVANFLVRTGDYLFWAGQQEQCYAAAVALAKLRNATDLPVMREVPRTKTLVQKLLGKNGGVHDSCATRALKAPVSSTSDLSRALTARAQFAACWWQEPGSQLADCYATLCGFRADGPPSNDEAYRHLGRAIAAFVLLEKHDPKMVEPRFRRLGNATVFLKALRRRCRRGKQDWQLVVDAFQDAIRASGLPQDLADQLVNEAPSGLGK